jgi:hypothetical protein
LLGPLDLTTGSRELCPSTVAQGHLLAQGVGLRTEANREHRTG